MAADPEMEPETLMSVLAGEGSEDDLRRVQAWRSADLRHERKYRDLERLWAGTGGLLEGEGGRAPSADEIIAIAEGRSGGRPIVRSVEERRRRELNA